MKSSLSCPNGLTVSWQYDANGQLLQVCNATSTNTISQYDYAYDSAGRRISMSKSGTAFNHNDTIAYGYNARSELTNAVASVDPNYRYAYEFDDIGNREISSEHGTNSVYTANSLNQYTAVDDFIPQFDDDGNQTLVKTATGIWSVTYNGENRPILWENGDTVVSMSYDRMGRRVTKNDQRFVYDGYLQIANFELSATNLQFRTHNLQLFVWDPTEPVATRPLVWNSLTFQPFNFSTSYYTHDGNKNVSEVVAENGDIAAHYDYAPFGSVNAQTGTLAVANLFRFSSEYADDTLRLVYFNYRHYEPITGRWLSRDLEESSNLYLLVNNNTSDCDFLGLSPLTDTLSEFFNPLTVGSFSKDVFRWPVGSGFIVLTLSVNIQYYSCCPESGSEKQEWISGDLTAELYYQLGLNLDYPANKKIHKLRRESGFNKNDRKKNQLVPHPCDPGVMINVANYNKYASACRKKARKPKGSVTSGGQLKVCPSQDGWGLAGGFFVRGSIGVGFGVIMDGRVDLWSIFHDKKGIIESMTGSVQGGWVIGASIDVGGWGSAWWESRIK